MVRGAKSEKGAQRRCLCLSRAFTKIALSKQKRLGTDTGQVFK